MSTGSSPYESATSTQQTSKSPPPLTANTNPDQQQQQQQLLQISANNDQHTEQQPKPELNCENSSASSSSYLGYDNSVQSSSSDTTSCEHKLLDSLIDHVIFCECLQVHRAAKMGIIFTEPGDEMYKIRDGVGVDVFGQPLSKKKQYNCVCPNCNRNLAASRLAPHLEKCMGMGRLSARAASANNRRDMTRDMSSKQ